MKKDEIELEKIKLEYEYHKSFINFMAITIFMVSLIFLQEIIHQSNLKNIASQLAYVVMSGSIIFLWWVGAHRIESKKNEFLDKLNNLCDKTQSEESKKE